MKSLVSFAAILVVSITMVYGQAPKSQRLVLLEEFTQASCGPCASQNPWIHNLLTSNPEKVTSINYHVSWPGYDPMYLHNTEDPSARVSYYGVTGVPHSVLDGNYFSGFPTGWNINTVNARYAMPSPCEIEIKHTLNSTQDTLHLLMLIKATATMTGSPMIGHLAVIEKHMHYNSAPGSNGEKDFYNVLKKMLPGFAGTTLPTMESGDYYVIEGDWKLANVFTPSELAAIGFVQNNQTKEVYQAANSKTDDVTPLYSNDAEILLIENLAPANCFGMVEPVVTLRNNGQNSLSQTIVKYQVNDGTPMVYNYTGNLGVFKKSILTLPAYNFDLEENNVLKVWSEMPNGSADEYPENDTLTVVIPMGFKAVPDIIVQVKTDKSPADFTWEIRDVNGDVVEQGGPYPNQSSLYKDTIQLPINTCYTFHALDAGGNGLCCDNGIGFVKLFDSEGHNFFVANKFGYESFTQFYVDSYVGIANRSVEPSLSVHPNPASDFLSIDLSLKSASNVIQIISDLTGKEIFKSSYGNLNAGNHDLSLDVSGLPNGIYLLRMQTDNGVLVKKVFIQR